MNSAEITPMDDRPPSLTPCVLGDDFAVFGTDPFCEFFPLALI
jgi:hypothetical protein